MSLSLDYRTRALISENPDMVDWYDVSSFGKLSHDFITKYQDYVIWEELTNYQDLKPQTLHDFADRFNWNLLLHYQKIPEQLIILHGGKISARAWHTYIPRFQSLSDQFILKYKDSLDMCMVYKYQKLSEQTIDYLLHTGHNIKWNIISQYQPLTPAMICKYKNYINMFHLCLNKHVNANKFTNYHIIDFADRFYDYIRSLSPYIGISGFHNSSAFVRSIKIRLFQLDLIVSKIQKQWKLCNLNPEYKICRKRLEREFNELIYT